MDDAAKTYKQAIEERNEGRMAARLGDASTEASRAANRAADYNTAVKFIQDLRKEGYAPGQAVRRIEAGLPAEVTFLRSGTTDKAFIEKQEEAVRKQFIREAALKIDQAMDPDGKIRPQYEDSLKAFKDGKSVAGQGLPVWKRMESSMETLSEKFSKVSKLAPYLPGVNKLAAAAGLASAAGGAFASTGTPDQIREARINAVKEVAGILDPTGVLVPSAIHLAAGQKGPTEFEKAVKDIAGLASNGEKQNNVGVINQQNLAIAREQKFLMSDQHPGQLCALTMKGPDGKPMDVEAMLRDPQQRQQVLGEIDRRAATASPQGKELFNEMKTAAIDFASLEDRRRAFTPAAPQPAQPQVAVAAAKPQAFAPA